MSQLPPEERCHLSPFQTRPPVPPGAAAVTWFTHCRPGLGTRAQGRLCQRGAPGAWPCRRPQFADLVPGETRAASWGPAHTPVPVRAGNLRSWPSGVHLCSQLPPPGTLLRDLEARGPPSLKGQLTPQAGPQAAPVLDPSSAPTSSPLSSVGRGLGAQQEGEGVVGGLQGGGEA